METYAGALSFFVFFLSQALNYILTILSLKIDPKQFADVVFIVADFLMFMMCLIRCMEAYTATLLSYRYLKAYMIAIILSLIAEFVGFGFIYHRYEDTTSYEWNITLLSISIFQLIWAIVDGFRIWKQFRVIEKSSINQ